MKVSIFNIAKGVTWTEEGHFYLNLANDKYELLVDYLNTSSIESLENDIDHLESF